MTEEAALAVTSLYPTLLSLAKAYTMLVSPLLIGTDVTSVCTHTSLAAPRAIDVQSNSALKNKSDRCAQEEMLKTMSDMVTAGASKNIFKLIGVEGLTPRT